MNEKTINLDFDSPRYKKWSFGGDIGYSRAGAYPTWDSDGNKRNTYRFGVSYFPNEEFQLYLGSKKIKEQEWPNGLRLTGWELLQNHKEI